MRQALKRKKKKVPKRGNANVKPKWREAWNQAIMKHDYSRKEDECVPIDKDDSINKCVPVEKDKEVSIIPKYVFHTWATKKLPTHMKKNLSLLKKKNPDFEFFLYDDEMCRDFIRTHFGLNELNAFDTLIPGAYKADLWRYCVLYVYGGIYMDIKLQTIDPFQLKHLLYEEHFPRDIDLNGYKAIWQGLLVCKPKNPILRMAIESICQHVRDYYYGPTYLSVTGPGLLYDIVQKHDKDVYKRSKTKLDAMNIPTITNHFGIYLNNMPIMYFYKDYYTERESRVDKQLHYSDYWKQNNIYHILFKSIHREVNPYMDSIPKYVFQTYSKDKMTTSMNHNIIQLRQKNPEMEYFLFDDDMCRTFINKHFGKRVVLAFDSLIPGAYKADLWRYCVLYIYGGMYIDIKLQTTNDFKLVEHINEECFPLDDISANACWQGFLVCKAGNTILKKAIEQIVDNVATKLYYDYSIQYAPLYITGPVLLGNIIKNEGTYDLKQSTIIHPQGSRHLNNRENNIIMTEYKDYRSDLKKNDHYDTLYKSKKIYNDTYINNDRFEVIVSFTTSPERIHKIKPMIESILNQSVKPDLFLLNIPKVFKRTNQTYTIPDFIQDYLIINTINIDYGPATKIIPTIEYLKNNKYDFDKTRIIYIDDDIWYSSKMIETFLKFSFDERCILCSSAMNIHKDLQGQYSFVPQRTHESKVQMVEGYGAVCLSPTIFKEDFMQYFMKYMNDSSAFSSDDLILSNYYHKEKINRCICINTKEYSIENMWKDNCILEYGFLNDALHKQKQDNISRYKYVTKLLNKQKDIFIHIAKHNQNLIMNIFNR